MYKAIKNEKIIAISDTDDKFLCLEKDSIVVDSEHKVEDYGEYKGEYLLKEDIPFDKEARIAELKEQLNGTDYKIIKCSECSLAGVELPYNIAALHAERQALRDEINQLEGE